VRPHGALSCLSPEESAIGYANMESKKALPTFAQPRRLRWTKFAAKLKLECSHLPTHVPGLSEESSSRRVARPLNCKKKQPRNRLARPLSGLEDSRGPKYSSQYLTFSRHVNFWIAGWANHA